MLRSALDNKLCLGLR